jgi:hypothetical protein
MQRTAWRGFGDGDAGVGAFPALSASDFTFATPPAGSWADYFAPPSPATSGIQDLVNALDARNAALVNVDPFTALQSKISAVVPSSARLPLILASVGLLALILTPSGGRGRR